MLNGTRLLTGDLVQFVSRRAAQPGRDEFYVRSATTNEWCKVKANTLGLVLSLAPVEALSPDYDYNEGDVWCIISDVGIVYVSKDLLKKL